MFRIRAINGGFIVEQNVRKCSLFRRNKWIPFVKTSGIDEAWVHGSYDAALDNLLLKVRWNTIENSNKQ